MIVTYNCIFNIHKGHQNVGVSFLDDIVTLLGMIFCNDKMLKHFILDILVKYVVIFWHFIWPHVLGCFGLIFKII